MSTDAASDADATGAHDRRRIAEALEALKRKESELRRALAIADHPELVDVIQELGGCAYAIAHVEAKMAKGLSKSEERRRDTLEKKRSTLEEKRTALDAQIADVERELHALGEERTRGFESERKNELSRLLVVLGRHGDTLKARGLDAEQLVPEVMRWMPEIEALACEWSASAPAEAE